MIFNKNTDLIGKSIAEFNPGTFGKNFKAIDWLLMLVILTGITATSISFIHNRSLWLDEASIALNIISRTLQGLFAPLDFYQMAPVGFMLLEKCSAILFGDHDWALRIVPFLSYLFSVPLFFLLAKHLLKSVTFALLASAIFANNPIYIYYASEVKQYATETLVSILMVYLVVSADSQYSVKRMITLALSGSIALWLSYSAVIILFSLGLFMIYNLRRNPENRLLQTAIPLITWVISFVIYYLIFIQPHSSRPDQVIMWARLNSFLPANPFSPEFTAFLSEKANWMFSRFPTFNHYWIAVLMVSCLGIIGLIKDKYILFIIFFSLFVHLVLSALKIYPFHHRLTLYLTPLILILFLAGVKLIFMKTDTIAPYLSVILLALFSLTLSWKAIRYVPVERSEIKQGMACLNQIVCNDDVILVNSFTGRSFRFYHKNYPAIASNQNTVYANWNLYTWNQEDSLKIVSAGKLWFLNFSQRIEKIETLTEEEFILKKLDHWGLIIKKKYEFTGGKLYLLVPQNSPDTVSGRQLSLKN
jgi:4-amino-4-deoxy-L-arabinose transferase-like glycosyltransferase